MYRSGIGSGSPVSTIMLAMPCAPYSSKSIWIIDLHVIKHTKAMKNQKAALLPLYLLSAGVGKRLKLNIIYNLRLPIREQTSLNSLMVPSIISLAVFTPSIKPTDWPDRAGAAFISPPKYRS